jgi:hypothetical protein
MNANTSSNPWPGRVGLGLSVLLGLLFLFSASGKFMMPPELVEGLKHLGIPLEAAKTIGVLEAASTLLYLIPQTAVLGAILLTGYLGGAIMTHLRIGEPVVTQAIIGVLVWGAVWLRDARLRQLLPLRR